jgi:hypothetical protein
MARRLRARLKYPKAQVQLCIAPGSGRGGLFFFWARIPVRFACPWRIGKLA